MLRDKMPNGVASARELAIMDKALEAYLRTYQITDKLHREDIAALVLELFNLGFRSEETLLAELISRRP
jgi:hypothetical protein